MWSFRYTKSLFSPSSLFAAWYTPPSHFHNLCLLPLTHYLPFNHCASPSPFCLPLLSFIIPPLFILQIYSQVYSNVVKDWEISEDARRLKYAAMKKEIRKGAGFSFIRFERHLFTVACRSNMHDKGVLFGMFYMVYCRYKVTLHHTALHCTTPHHTVLHCTIMTLPVF